MEQYCGITILLRHKSFLRYYLAIEHRQRVADNNPREHYVEIKNVSSQRFGFGHGRLFVDKLCRYLDIWQILHL